MLDRPGEWYLDRATGVLSYWPLPKQDMAKAEAIAPVLRTVLEVKGRPDKPVRNVHFKGIQFSHTTWEEPEWGFIGAQAAIYRLNNALQDGPGRFGRHEDAVRFEYAQGCSVEDGAIAHVGETGISLRQGCVNNLIQDNRVFDTGGNGIMVGERIDPTNAVDAVRANRVANNFVHDCGVVFHGAVGVWVGFTDGTVVSHNLVRDLPYTGISNGWSWDMKPTGCMSNVVEFNHVHHVMELLADGGGIYNLGFQPGSVIRGNHVHDITRNNLSAAGYGHSGIYLDEGSKGFLVQSNVVYRTRAFNFNIAPQADPNAHNQIADNFADVEPGQPKFPKSIADKAGPVPQFYKTLGLSPKGDK
jgi:hypothetical protein